MEKRKYSDKAKKVADRIISDCKKEEIKENGFKVSFGIAIIILGIFSIFYKTNNSVLIGISISSFLFILCDSMKNNNKLWYIIPLTIMLIFCVFPQVKILNFLLKEAVSNTIVFISFGLSIILNSYISYQERLKHAKEMMYENGRYLNLTQNDMENSIKIMSSVNRVLQICNDENIESAELIHEIDKLASYSDRKVIIARVRKEMVEKGLNKNKNVFNVDEIEEVLLKNSGIFEEIERK